jgi:hypothetical protein
LRQLIATIIIDAFLLFTVYFASEAQLTSRGYMIYTEWSGNLILAVVIITCNIRVILMSNQFNIMQGFLVAFGIISYFIITFLVGVILENDIKNVLPQSISTGIFWLLVIMSLFSYSLQVSSLKAPNYSL